MIFVFSFVNRNPRHDISFCFVVSIILRVAIHPIWALPVGYPFGVVSSDENQLAKFSAKESEEEHVVEPCEEELEKDFLGYISGLESEKLACKAGREVV